MDFGGAVMDFYTNNPLRNGGALTTHNPLIAQGDAYFGVLRRWSGSVWAKAHLKRYNGASWIDTLLKVYDSGEWKTVDTNG